MTEHPITPSPELVEQWIANDDFPFATGTLDLVSITKDRLRSIATQAARWGADQELEACCEWVEAYAECGNALRAACRPKPPSLKEQALAVLEDASNRLDAAHENIIRRAIEALPDES